MNKSILLSVILLASTSVFACPELTGSWSCKDADGNVDTVSYTQEAIQNGVLYHITNSNNETYDLYVDGVSRTTEDEEVTQTITSKCAAANRVEMHMDTLGKQTGMFIHTEIALELTGTGALAATAQNIFEAADGNKKSSSSSMSCTKQ